MNLKVQEVLSFEQTTELALPLFSSSVMAGFPSPADDHIERKLDLNEHLVSNPIATYFLRVSGDSMIEAGIQAGDVLVVDRSLDACDGKIVIAELDGELTVKRLKKANGKLLLLPENPNYSPIEVKEESDLQIWGTVTYVIHKAK